MWSDHWIGDEEGFRRQLQVVAESIEEGLEMVRFGVNPAFAATNFGYIELGLVDPDHQNLHQLKSFYEKPDVKTAEKFLAAGCYLWNMGYFMTTAERFEGLVAEANPRLYESLEQVLACSDQAAIEKLYDHLPEISFESEVAKNITKARVVACDFAWADIGSFRDLLSVLPVDSHNNAIFGSVHTRGVFGSYINNQTKAPLAVLGLENVAVVATEQGILVADPQLVAEIGEISKLIEFQGKSGQL